MLCAGAAAGGPAREGVDARPLQAAHAIAGAQAPFLRRLAQVSVRSLTPPSPSPFLPSSPAHLLVSPSTLPSRHRTLHPPSPATARHAHPIVHPHNKAHSTTRLLLDYYYSASRTDAQQTRNRPLTCRDSVGTVRESACGIPARELHRPVTGFTLLLGDVLVRLTLMYLFFLVLVVLITPSTTTNCDRP